MGSPKWVSSLSSCGYIWLLYRSKKLLWWGEARGRNPYVWLPSATWHWYVTFLLFFFFLFGICFEHCCRHLFMIIRLILPFKRTLAYCISCTSYWSWLQVLIAEIRVARIFNTYGPRMNIDDGRVVSNFIAQALRYCIFFADFFCFACHKFVRNTLLKELKTFRLQHVCFHWGYDMHENLSDRPQIRVEFTIQCLISAYSTRES